MDSWKRPSWLPSASFGLALAGVGAVGVLDRVTTREVSFSIFYLLPISFAAWFSGRAPGIVISLIATAAWFSIERSHRMPGAAAAVDAWNAMVRLALFVIVTLLLHRIRYLNRHLRAMVRQGTLALTQRVIQCEEGEREIAEISQREQERLAGELHDGLAGHLGGTLFRANALAERLARRGALEADAAMELASAVSSALDIARGMARLLSPGDIQGESLESALQQLGNEFATLFGVTCHVRVPRDGLPALGGERIFQFTRITQEAMRNAVRHGRARCIELTVTREPGFLILRIAADGRALPTAPNSEHGGMGVRIMYHRARILGGELTRRSGTNGGSIVECRIPLDEPVLANPSHES